MRDFLLKFDPKRMLPVVTLLAFFSVNTYADIRLSFGVYTSDKPSAMVKKFRPIINTLEKMLAAELESPVKIKMQVAKSYEEGIQDIVTGNVDFSRLGPASYVEAKQQNPGLSILAIESKGGKKRFKGIICIREDSSIETISDLKGKRFAFGNQRSTIGRYLSQLYLAENGIKATDLAGFDYLGRHDKVGEAVALGRYDAGALKNGTFKRLVKNGRKLKALATFFNVTKPWVASSQMSEKMKKAITNALLSMQDQAALKILKKDGFIEGSDADYEHIRKSIDKNKMFFK